MHAVMLLVAELAYSSINAGGSAEEFGADTDIQEAQNHAQVNPSYWAFVITNSGASHS